MPQMHFSGQPLFSFPPNSQTFYRPAVFQLLSGSPPQCNSPIITQTPSPSPGTSGNSSRATKTSSEGKKEIKGFRLDRRRNSWYTQTMGAEGRQAPQRVQQGQGEDMERYFRCIQGNVPRQWKNFTPGKETYPESRIRVQAFKATVSFDGWSRV